MNQDIVEFLAEGRKLRASQRRGMVLLVEQDPWMRGVVEDWLLQKQCPLISCASIEEAEAFLFQEPQFIILGVSTRIYCRVLQFLKRVDEQYPSTISVVVSDCQECLLDLRERLPRVTIVLKGEGLEDTIKNILPQGRLS